jgi:hypothetical protein
MTDHIRQTIADLQKSLIEDQQKVLDKKHLINQLAAHAGMGRIYTDAELQSGPSVNLAIQSDQFYGQPLASSIRTVLELRKALNQGPATINEIHAALVEGGFAFETKNEDNAKRGLRISITKNTSLFHKLPNAKFGLLEWYPNVKQAKGGKAATDDISDLVGDSDEDSGELGSVAKGGELGSAAVSKASVG